LGQGIGAIFKDQAVLEDFSFLETVWTGPPVLFPGLKRPGREVYQSPPSSAKVKNGWQSALKPIQCVHSMDTENYTFLV